MTTLPYKHKDRIVVPNEGLVGRDGHDYFADPHLVAAANAAVVLGRPLLLTGEPGCGKTDFAHAVAKATQSELFVCHVRSDSQARDLLYHYDALHRFGDAHMDGESRGHSTDARRYVELLELGNALIAPQRQVVLIDEIDKAPRDLPNDLLHELDGDSFEIKELRASYPKLAVDEPDRALLETRWGQPKQRVMRRPAGAANKPIVIITSNVERQLPDAFLRRCLFFHITFPKRNELTRILIAKFGPKPYVDQLVGLFLALRAVDKLIKKPATSELLDWAQSLGELHDDEVVRGRLAPLHAALPEQPWAELPGLACLLKQRDDLFTVGAGS